MQVALICLAMLVGGEPGMKLSPLQKQFVVRAEQQRQDAIYRTENAIKRAKKKGRRRARREIGGLEARLKRLEANDPPFLPTMRRLKIGEVGLLKDQRFYVIQITNKREMIGRTHDSVETFWCRGTRTEDLVDGEMTHLDDVFHVSGTKRYNSTDGATKTVRVIEPFDISWYPKYLAKNRPEAKPKKK